MIRADKAEQTAIAINKDGGAAIAVAGDVTDSVVIETLVHEAVKFGNGKLHIIINNAGYAWDDPIDKIKDKQWETIINLHNTAPFKLIRAAAPYFMVKDGEPRSIVNISSTSGIYGNAGQASYALAKAGLVGLTKTMAQEWGPEYGVRANGTKYVLSRLVVRLMLKLRQLLPSAPFERDSPKLQQANMSCDQMGQNML